MTLHEPERLDEDKPDEECPTCERVLIDGDPQHWAGCPEEGIEHAERYGSGSEPDFEQMVEDRAARHGPDPEAVMWGGVDTPS